MMSGKVERSAPLNVCSPLTMENSISHRAWGTLWGLCGDFVACYAFRHLICVFIMARALNKSGLMEDPKAFRQLWKTFSQIGAFVCIKDFPQQMDSYCAAGH